MKRVLALLVALALLGGAFLVREQVLGDDGSGAEDGTPTSGSDDEQARLVCATELAEACEALAADVDGIVLTVEPAGVTADRLTSPDTDALDPGLDAWLVPAPWPDIVAEGRARAGLPAVLAPTTDLPVLARSPLVLAVWDDRAEVLGTVCAGEITWACVGEVAGEAWADLGGSPTWGPVKPGHDSPAPSARGLGVLSQAATSFFGRSDLTANDLAEPAFQSWFARLERAVPTFEPSTGSAFDQMVVVGPASFDAVGTTESQAGPLLARSPARADAITLLYPSPVASLDVVLAGTTTGAAERLESVVAGEAGAGALATAGWRVPGQPDAVGVSPTPALPDGSNLPPAGTQEALRQLWVEVVG